MAQINVGTNIEILDKETARNIVLKNIKNEYLYLLSDWEIKARTNNESDSKESYLNKLSESFENFNSEQKKFLLDSALNAKRKLSISNSFENLPFRFVFLAGNIDWGYTYTTGDIIVLRERDFSRNSNDLTNLIIHEYCHVYQRFYLDMLKELYNNWGFTKVILQNKLKENTVLNPDGIDTWMFSYNSNNYVPSLIGRSNNRFIPYAIKVVDNKYSNEAIEINMLKSFSNKFFNVGQLYHPNEIMAHLVPLYLDKKLVAMNEEQQQVIQSLKKWLFK